MKAIELRDVDKSTWAPGPWKEEPDRMQWEDEATKLPCLVVRNERTGILCGYVGVSRGHPLFEVPYQDVEGYYEKERLHDIAVHGGLTFSDHCLEGGRICHTVEPGEDDQVWWFGFDCGHGGDLHPNLGMNVSRIFFEGLGERGQIYRNVPYAKNECARLAQQLAEIGAAGE